MIKKIIFVLFMVIVLGSVMLLEASQNIYYSGIARNSSGTILSNQTVSIKTIFLDDSDQSTVYSETQIVYTNKYGGYSFIFGNGTVASGTFTNVDVSSTDYIVEILIDDSAPFSTYTLLETRNFLSLLIGKSASSASLPISGNNSEIGMLKTFSDDNVRDGWTYTGVSEAVGSPDTWTTMSLSGAPSPVGGNSYIWTGKEMIIWGGYTGSLYMNTGYKYNPETNTWSVISTTNAPAARKDHQGIWTGKEMIIWGGYDGTNYLTTGSIYNPINDTWTAMTNTNAPSTAVANMRCRAVWTGEEMIVWGGYTSGSGYTNTGARYNPATDTWTTMTVTNAPTARYEHSAVWTGTEMIIWGGTSGSQIGAGASYNPVNDSWTNISITGDPIDRYYHTAIWTGKHMIIWGGFNQAMNGAGYFNSGGLYNPTTDSWSGTTTTGAPAVRAVHVAVWTGAKMIVWGGSDHGTAMGGGGIYDPTLDSWASLTITNDPADRYFHVGIWTGKEMVIWGGGITGTLYNTGGKLSGTQSIYWFKKDIK